MKKLTPKELISFFQGLSTLLRAGLELVPALELTAQQHTTLAREVTQICLSLREGQALTTALARYCLLPHDLLNTLKVGENTGDLAQACSLCLQQVQTQLAWKRMIFSLSFYPILLLITGLGLFWVMVGFVLPEFASLYQTLEVSLPPSTQWLLQLAHRAPTFLSRFMAGLVLFILLIGFAWRTPSGRFTLERCLFHLPLIRDCFRTHYQYLLAQQLGLLLQAGASLINALEVIKQGTQSPSFAHYLSQVQQGIRQGLGLKRSFHQGCYHDPRLNLLLAHAEKTGQLDQIFLSLATQHQEALAHWQEQGKTIFQPIITLILGGFLGLWLLLLYYPMLQLGTNLG